MSYYPNDFVERVRLASDIVSLIGEDTELRGRGDRFMGLCPFPEHNEKTPSFSVSAGKQVYNCFGCQNAGNIFTYLQKQRGMRFVEAIEYLARKRGIPLPQPIAARQKARAASAGLFELSEKVCQFYERQISPSARDYLKKRGWAEETVKSFRLGYAPKGNALLSFLKTQRERSMAQQLGLINRSTTSELYDNFRHRLIFPIISQRRQTIGFGARALGDSHPKYINSKESPIFHKGRSFYGLNESARYLRQKSFALIVEGYADFLSLWQAGFKNLVATLGTALTQDQALLLRRYADSAVLVFDGDEAGLKASERSLPLLLSAGLRVKFVSLPKDQDPDDFIKTSGEKAFQELLKSAKDLFFFVLQKSYESLKQEERDSLFLIERMAPLLSSTEDKALRALYKQRLLDLFGSDAGLINKTLDEKIKSRAKAVSYSAALPAPPDPSPAFSLAEALAPERLLLALCLESEDFLKAFIEREGLSRLKTQGIIGIFKKILDSYSQNGLNFGSLSHLAMNEISDSGLIFKSSYPIFKEAGKEGEEKIFQDCLDFLEKKRKISSASALLAKMKMDPKEDMRDLEKVFQLTKQRLARRDKPKA